MNFHRLIFYAVIFAINPVVMADQRLDLLKQIAVAGAPELTLKILDQTQPHIDADLYQWIVWEQEKYKILSHWQQWHRLLETLESLPADIPVQFQHQVATYKAQAYLALGQTGAARQVLREQLWQERVDLIDEYQTWRRLIIESYLQEGREENARIAMLRFEQDFESQSASWLLQRATILIQTGRYDQAIQVLAGQQSWQARHTALLARLYAGRITANDLWVRVKEDLGDLDVSSEESVNLRALAVFAAQKMSPVDRVIALEQYFKQATSSPVPLFKIDIDQLWQAYVEYADLIGNLTELLIGEDDVWLQVAQQTAGVTPVKARSLFVFLMLNSRDSDIINAAADGYLQTFAAIEIAEYRLLDQLFGHSKAFEEVARIPVFMRYQLIDLALKNADIAGAARLMSGLTSYPQSSNRLSWQLRQSRVLILGGRHEEGNQVMQTLMAEYTEPNAADTDKILQILFDLQTIGLHEEAIQHFTQLRNIGVAPRQQREILFWTGDSYKALKKYDQAAQLYLQSAMLTAVEAMDPWAQTARFNAAESLTKSGLVDDARRIYQGLLAVTQEPERRALLNHNIQQLWLQSQTR